MTCILPPFPPCADTCVSPPYRVSLETDVDMIIHMVNLILLKYSKTHCLCDSLYQSFLVIIFIGGRKNSEQQINLKGDGGGYELFR